MPLAFFVLARSLWRLELIHLDGRAPLLAVEYLALEDLDVVDAAVVDLDAAAWQSPLAKDSLHRVEGRLQQVVGVGLVRGAAQLEPVLDAHCDARVVGRWRERALSVDGAGDLLLPEP